MNELFAIYDRWNGIIPLLLGVYLVLAVRGYVPRNPKDPERLAEWRRKFGPTMKWLAPLVMVSGAIQLGIGLSSEPTNLNAKRAFAEFYRANDARVSRGKTLESAHQFVTDLKKINATDLPPDLGAALSDYTGAFEEGLRLLEASKPTTSADARLTEAKQRLQALERKYLH